MSNSSIYSRVSVGITANGSGIGDVAHSLSLIELLMF